MLLKALTLKTGQESPRKAKQVALLSRSTLLLSLPECKLAAAEEELLIVLHLNMFSDDGLACMIKKSVICTVNHCGKHINQSWDPEYVVRKRTACRSPSVRREDAQLCRTTKYSLWIPYCFKHMAGTGSSALAPRQHREPCEAHVCRVFCIRRVAIPSDGRNGWVSPAERPSAPTTIVFQYHRGTRELSRGRALLCEEALARFGTYEIHVSVHVRLQSLIALA